MANVPIQPLEDYIVVQQEEASSKTASGLYLPDNAQEKPKTAKVVAVGKDVDAIKVGDRVIYKNQYEATEVKVDREDFIIVFKKNVVAIVK